MTRNIFGITLAVAFGAACASGPTPPPATEPRELEGYVLQPEPSVETIRAVQRKVRELYGSDAGPSFEAVTYSRKMGSAAGDTARGVLILEEDGELFLDVDPCNVKIVTFREPYVKRDAGEITCKNGKKYPRKEIEQRPRRKRVKTP